MENVSENPGEIRYCSCDRYLGQTGGRLSYGKTVVIVPNGCEQCQREYNLRERAEHE